MKCEKLSSDTFWQHCFHGQSHLEICAADRECSEMPKAVAGAAVGIGIGFDVVEVPVGLGHGIGVEKW